MRKDPLALSFLEIMRNSELNNTSKFPPDFVSDNTPTLLHLDLKKLTLQGTQVCLHRVKIKSRYLTIITGET